MSFSRFKVLTFDVVGTLIDFESGIRDAVSRIAGRASESLGEDRLFAAYLRGRARHHGRSSEAFAHVWRELAAELDLPAGDAAADAFQMAVLRWQPFPDAVAALARLRMRFRLVAMTNADRTAFSAYAHALGNPFHDSVTMDDTGTGKPDPMFFAFNRGRQSAFGYRQQDILHVAQSQYHDIGVAHRLGYSTCWIERRQGLAGFGGTPAPEAVTRPDFHYPSLAAFADAVEQAAA